MLSITLGTKEKRTPLPKLIEFRFENVKEPEMSGC